MGNLGVGIYSDGVEARNNSRQGRVSAKRNSEMEGCSTCQRFLGISGFSPSEWASWAREDRSLLASQPLDLPFKFSRILSAGVPQSVEGLWPHLAVDVLTSDLCSHSCKMRLAP